MIGLIGPKRNSGLILVLAGLVGLLSLELAVGPFFVPDVPQEISNVKIPGNVKSPPPENPPMSAFGEVVARPLFAPTRRPAPPKPKNTQIVSATVPEPFDLVGVVLSPTARAALLRPRVKGKALRVTEGQLVSGWKVREIKSNQVILQPVGSTTDSEIIKLSTVRTPSPASSASKLLPKREPTTLESSPPQQEPSPPPPEAEDSQQAE
jgi:hypothetical protein